MNAIPQIRLADGARVPALGLGTWTMGERASARADEVAALRAGLDLGMTLVDTAEMYGEGGAEKIVGEAIRGRRDDVFVVSKVYPHNATARGTIAACERSLLRLGIEQLDLYLLHWRGTVPLGQTVRAFERLVADGKIARWGVSNFDTADIDELLHVEGGTHCAVNQVLYHLDERGVEWSLGPRCRDAGIALMAYSPLGQGRLLAKRRLQALAASAGTSPAALALAWLLHHKAIVVAQSSSVAHLRGNRDATEIVLDNATLTAIDEAFPPPAAKRPLAVL